MSTSVNGVLTGRGAHTLILDDILKPDDALSETRRRGGKRVVLQHPVEPAEQQRERRSS